MDAKRRAVRLWCAVVLTACCLPAATTVQAAEYLGPTDVVAAPDGKTLYVAASDAQRILVVDPADGSVVRSIDMPVCPTGLVISPDGGTLYVTCAAPEGTVAVIDVAQGKIVDTIEVGHWPTGPAISPDGKTLYVCNRFNDNVAVIYLEAKKVVTVPAVRQPIAAAVTPDGKTVFVANHLSVDKGTAYDMATVVTAIDAATLKTESIRLCNGSINMRGICVSPDGGFVYATHVLARYQMPTTQPERGWISTNGLTVIDAREKKYITTILLDDIDLGAADPWGVACTADGKKLCVTLAGGQQLCVLDAEAMHKKLPTIPDRDSPPKDGQYYHSRTKDDIPNDLSFLCDMRRLAFLGGDEKTAVGPRGLAIVESKAYIAARFSEQMPVVNLIAKKVIPEPIDGEPQEPIWVHDVDTIRLGPDVKLTKERRGEMLFNDGQVGFQQWFSCASCHPEGRTNGLPRDLMSDGLGNPKDCRSLLLAHRTPPSMASGVRVSAEIAVWAKIKFIMFALRPEEDAKAIDAYLKSLEAVPSPHLIDGRLSPAAVRGEQLFSSERVNCAKCHPGPLFTDKQMHDVGSKGEFDRRDTFDTPTLVEVWRTAPYLHDGRYPTIGELLHKGRHGITDEMKLNPNEIDDLAEYVKSL